MSMCGRSCLALRMHLCPVCGYPELREPAWDNGSGSDAICPCCGTHFGYDDAAGGDAAERERAWSELRRAWENKGCPWFSVQRTPPVGWDPHAQMRAFD